MKVIDLLVKIWNNELEDKTRVIFKKHNTECIYQKDERRFEFVNKGDWNNYFDRFTIKELDDEVEIIEDKSKKITSLNLNNFSDEYEEKICLKIEELIQAVNYLLEKSDNK